MKNVLLIPCLFIVFSGFGQDEKHGTIKIEKPKEKISLVEIREVKDSAVNQVFTIVEVMPSFIGGQDAMFSFISKNVTYPKSAKKKGVHASCRINFL